jgi:hypothetical protein
MYAQRVIPCCKHFAAESGLPLGALGPLAAQASIGRQGSQHLPKLPFHGNLCGHFVGVFIFPVRRTDSFRSITTPWLAPVPAAAHD